MIFKDSRQIQILIIISFLISENVSPKITFPTHADDFISGYVGDQLFISCEVTGSPKPNKYWLRNGVKIHSCPNTLEAKCTYVIQRATYLDNNGEYECVGENLIKTVSRSLTVEIKGILWEKSKL